MHRVQIHDRHRPDIPHKISPPLKIVILLQRQPERGPETREVADEGLVTPRHLVVVKDVVVADRGDDEGATRVEGFEEGGEDVFVIGEDVEGCAGDGVVAIVAGCIALIGLEW